MTVLMQIIKWFDSVHGESQFDAESLKKYLSDQLPAEEQQIRDAYIAGQNREWANHFGKTPNPEPDIESYITQLNK